MEPWITLTSADMDAGAIALRNQYYALRSKAFEARWGENFYPDGPDTYDLRPNTAYILHVEDGRVIAGGRVIFHTPGSHEKVPMEINHSHLALETLLPHCDTEALCYCEVSGAVADPDSAYRARHLGTALAKKRLELLKSGDIKNGSYPTAIILGAVSNTNLGPFVRAVNEAGIQGIIRDDLVAKEENKRFDTKIWPAMLALDSQLPLITDEMRAKGAVATPFANYTMPDDRYK